jgi:ATP-dependent Clp protease ATP-binding subunit ClpB
LFYIKRGIQRYLETAIAKSILKSEFKAGDTICVDVEDERLSLKKLPANFLAKA